MEINEDAFRKMDAADRDLLIFRNIQCLEAKLDKRKFINSCVAFASGVIGGAGAVIMNWAFFGGNK